MGLAQISPAQEEWFIMQRNEIPHLSMIGLHRHVLGHFHTCLLYTSDAADKVAF